MLCDYNSVVSSSKSDMKTYCKQYKTLHNTLDDISEEFKKFKFKVTKEEFKNLFEQTMIFANSCVYDKSLLKPKTGFGINKIKDLLEKIEGLSKFIDGIDQSFLNDLSNYVVSFSNKNNEVLKSIILLFTDSANKIRSDNAINVVKIH